MTSEELTELEADANQQRLENPKRIPKNSRSRCRRRKCSQYTLKLLEFIDAINCTWVVGRLAHEMSFVSLSFIAFMAIVVLLYYAAPTRARWSILLVASYVFFWINSEWLVIALFAQTLGTFLFGLWIQRVENEGTSRLAAIEDKSELKTAKIALRTRKRWIMAFGIVFNLAFLLVMKYCDFFIANTNALLGMVGVHLPSLGLIVPIGLSFYTLQAIAYLVDLRRGKMEADRNLMHFMLFMSYFPQILQGPIPRFSQLAHQLYEGHRFDYTRFCYGAQLILWGFMKKLVLADRIAIPVNQIFNNWTYYDGGIVFLAAVGYGLQVYADFSGGVDIARGFSQVIGIELVDNFRQPYFSRSVTEFWRRWHITLGSWMRDYVFYPLSMSKALTKFGKLSGKVLGAKTGRRLSPCIATFIAFFFVGFWHGPDWSFVAYGVWNGFFLALATLLPEFYAFVNRKLHIPENTGSWIFFQMFRTFLIASVSRFFTRAPSLKVALGMIQSVTVGWYDLSFIVDGSFVNLGLDVANWIVLLLMIGVLTGVDVAHERGVHIREAIGRQGIVARWIIYLAAFAVVLVFGVYGSGYDATSFVYAQY